MKFQAFFLLIAALLCSASETKIYQGKNYRLDYSHRMAISIRHPDGSFAPFLNRISFDATDREWTPLFRTASFSTHLLERNGDHERISFKYGFTGQQAERITLTGIIDARPDLLRVRFNGIYRGNMDHAFHKRIIFSYAEEEQRLLGSNADNGPEGGTCGLRAEFAPGLRLAFNRKQKCSSGTPPWQGKDGLYQFELDMALTPWLTRPPLFSGLSDEPVEIAIQFRRYCNVLLPGDVPEAELNLLNRTEKDRNETVRLEIFDHRKKLLETCMIPLRAKAGAVSRQIIALPSGRTGYFELRLTRENGSSLTRSYCVLPPTERKFKKNSIFGGMLYPWNRKSTDKLDLMEWIGIGTLRVRGAYRIVRDGKAGPALPPGGVYSKADTEEIFSEQNKRQIEAVPLGTESWKYPAGTFRLTEAANEVNAVRLPVDFAEEMKIEYVKTKQHDPALMVGGSGLAGVDTRWLEEFQANGAWDYMDALFVHLHCFPRAPEVNNTMTREYWLHDRVTLLRGLMDRFGEKPVYDSENGYLTLYPDRRVEKYPLRSVSDRSMAATFMVRSYLQGLAYGLSGKMWFTIDSYGGFGLTEYGQPRPAYPAYAVMTRLLDGAEYAGELLSPGRISSVMDRNTEFSRSWFGQATPGLEKELLSADREKTELNINPDLKPYTYIRVFRTPDNRPVLAAWATLYRQKVEPNPVDTPAWSDQKPGTSLLWNGRPAAGDPEPLPVRFRVGSDEVEIVDMMGNSRKVKTDNGFLTLPLDDYPQYILGAAPDLLKEAERFNLTLFPKKFRPNNRWKTLIQAVLPAEKRHPRRKSVFDKLNLSAELKTGTPYTVHVRLTNLNSRPESGRITLRLPEGWKSSPQEVRFSIAGKTEKQIAATFTVTPDKPVATAKIVSLTESDRQGRIADSVMNVSVR